MLKVGITGGIGSGKTTVCRIFEALSIPVYYADLRARELMQSDEELRSAIRTAFGQEAYTADNQLNRAHLAACVFSDKSRLDQLNGLVHPAVRKDSREWMERQARHPYVLYEAAILFESGAYRNMDKVVAVTAPESLRVDRVTQRDGSSREEVVARMRHQISDTERNRRADYVILNDETVPLTGQVLDIHKELLSICSR